jgi:hypothetical protein
LPLRISLVPFMGRACTTGDPRDPRSSCERMLKSDVKYRFVIDMQTLKDGARTA